MKVIFYAAIAVLISMNAHGEVTHEEAGMKISESAAHKKVVVIDIQDAQTDVVKIKLRRTFEVSDCNDRVLAAKPVLVGGNGSGRYDQYYVRETVSSTVIGCPTEKRMIEVLSAPLSFKTSQLPNSNRRELFVFLTVHETDTIIRVQ